MHVIFLYTWDECSLDDRGLRLGLPSGRSLLARAAGQGKRML